MRLFFFTLVFVLTACGDPASSASFAPAAAPNGPGIYFWQTSWEPDEFTPDELPNAGAEQLFLRLFDVDFDFNREQARPKGLLRLPDSLRVPQDLAVIPVVFIVERVFGQNVDVEDLARRTGRTISGMSAPHPGLAGAKRWQIDCDWTPVSRDRYFSFLRALQKQNPGITISVTIRLHQYRERTLNGIPPAPEGMLMCYNMEPVSDVLTRNAIYREDLLRGYLKAPPYPVTLDAALPIFSWGAAFRDERFLGIVDAPASLPGHQEAIAPGRFLVLQDTTLGSTFLRAGDNIRRDGPGSAEELKAAARLLKEVPGVRDLLFFDWQKDQAKKYPLREIWEEFYR